MSQKMKFKFESDLVHQQKAIDSIVGIFRGQEACSSPFTVPSTGLLTKGSGETSIGTANRLMLTQEELLENVRSIQRTNGLRESKALGSMDFTVEMETGTGKTYVYLRTIYEMNKNYGFTKFVIVVPSIAIKEGVAKSIDMTKEHFKSLYDNANTSEAFVYDSGDLPRLGHFADAAHIQIMIINIDAMRKNINKDGKEGRLIHRRHDRMNGARPIDLIQLTNPVVIIDEPQSVDNTDKAKESIAELNPLCCLRYSATHREQFNMMYRLDSIDAYMHELVKQIEVYSTQVDSGANTAYVKLLKTDIKKQQAEVEIDQQQNNGSVKRTKVKIGAGDTLYEKSGERDLYRNMLIDSINFDKGSECIEIKGDPLYLGQSVGEVDDSQIKRAQIHRTIQEHFEKELKLRPLGIKVLSLFFIDRVSNYRQYAEDGSHINGPYAAMFEEEFIKIAKNPRYRELFDGTNSQDIVANLHNGYFSTDKKKTKNGNKVEMYKDSSGKTKADEDTFSLIMRDKEKLLSLDTPLKFIFSHSALREGWDNPNVFQICTLNDTSAVIKKRQEIGRGLRLAVNQKGERIQGFEVNTLTVMANEAYDDFVRALQEEISQEEGIRFGYVEADLFATIIDRKDDGTEFALGDSAAQELIQIFEEKQYIDRTGKVQDKLKLAVKEKSIELPDKYAHLQGVILKQLGKALGNNLNCKNARDRKPLKVNTKIFESPEFKELWKRINHKTTYSVNFDTDELIKECAKSLAEIKISGTRIVTESGKIVIDHSGLSTKAGTTSKTNQTLNVSFSSLPDIVGYLQNETRLTRATLTAILLQCGTLSQFMKNPQKFIEEALARIKDTMKTFIVDGIKYEETGEFWDQSLFLKDELIGYIHDNMVEASKCVFDHVLKDSGIENTFSDELERDEDVKLYAKLPSWFKIATPLGPYNPDWAVLYEKNGEQKLYFVVETKGDYLNSQLRPAEKMKIECGKKHFAVHLPRAEYVLAKDMEGFLGNV